ncbi:MAG: MaoC family dehydratase N-terminal domain-containing protein [Dehalococcoidales bacterium]|nr:MaoC family dehydratase N-terminal domain-containing protein [Dehalococcoidales bacterium]
MKKYLTREEIAQAKADKTIRDRIRISLEDDMDLGQMQLCTIDKCGGFGMGRREATEDAIRVICYANGDLNPLYLSRDYARDSLYGEIIAPPYFISSVAGFTGAGIVRKREPEYAMGGVDAGSKVEWFKPVREGDRFTVFDVPKEVIDLTREHTPIQFLSRGERIYKNQKDEIIAVATGSLIQTIVPPPEEGQRPVIKAPEQRTFSLQEIEEWYHLINNEEIRGAEPRFWEDVNEDDQLPPTRHVFTMMENVAFMVGWGVGSGCWKLQMDRSKETWSRLIDPKTGLPEFVGPHMTEASAQLMGIPTANSAGIQMYAWLCRLVTNWMGDAGFLKALEAQYRRPLWLGSMALCKGRIVKKYVEGNECLVDLHISVEDRDGNPVIPNGSATVMLPSKHWKF